MRPLHGHRGPLYGIRFWSYPKRTINGSLDTEAAYALAQYATHSRLFGHVVTDVGHLLPRPFSMVW